MNKNKINELAIFEMSNKKKAQSKDNTSVSVSASSTPKSSHSGKSTAQKHN